MEAQRSEALGYSTRHKVRRNDNMQLRASLNRFNVHDVASNMREQNVK